MLNSLKGGWTWEADTEKWHTTGFYDLMRIRKRKPPKIPKYYKEVKFIN